MGRPAKVLTPEMVATILHQAENGLPQRLIAQGQGVTESCFSNWLERQPEFREAFHAARTRGAQALIDEIRRGKQGPGQADWKARAWILSRMFPTEFANPEKVALNVQTSVTNTVNVAIPKEKLDEIHKRRAAALEAHGRN